MSQLTVERVRELMDQAEAPCLSLYQPTYRSFSDKRQNITRFKNLYRDLRNGFKERYPDENSQALFETFEGLLSDDDFWNHAQDGLAILACPGRSEVFKVQRRLPEAAFAGDSFFLKPLFRYAQSADRFHVLALTRTQVRLYEGNRYSLDEVGFEEDFLETLRSKLGDQARAIDPYTIESTLDAGTDSGKFGQGTRADEIENDKVRFFRAVDETVYEHVSQSSGAPLVLAGLPDNLSTFRSVAKNPSIWEKDIEADPGSMESRTLRESAWKLLEPYYLDRLSRFIETYGKAKANGQGTDELEEAVKAASQGRIQSLLIEDDRHVHGSLDASAGKITQTKGETAASDVLDDLAELVIATDGEVIVVPKERMPTTTGLAATFRF